MPRASCQKQGQALQSGLHESQNDQTPLIGTGWSRHPPKRPTNASARRQQLPHAHCNAEQQRACYVLSCTPIRVANKYSLYPAIICFNTNDTGGKKCRLLNPIAVNLDPRLAKTYRLSTKLNEAGSGCHVKTVLPSCNKRCSAKSLCLRRPSEVWTAGNHSGGSSPQPSTTCLGAVQKGQVHTLSACNHTPSCASCTTLHVPYRGSPAGTRNACTTPTQRWPAATQGNCPRVVGHGQLPCGFFWRPVYLCLRQSACRRRPTCSGPYTRQLNSAAMLSCTRMQPSPVNNCHTTNSSGAHLLLRPTNIAVHLRKQ